MRFLDTQAGWEWFVERTVRHPLFPGRFALEQRGPRVVLCEARSQKIIRNLLAPILTVGFTLGATWLFANDGAPSAALACLVVAISLLGGWIARIVHHSCVHWSLHPPLLTLERGRWPRRRVLQLSAGDIRAELSVAAGGGLFHGLKEGHFVLSLACAGFQGPINLVCAPKRSTVAPVLRGLQALLGEQHVDRTTERVEVEEDSVMPVARWPMGLNAREPRQLRLAFRSGDTAVFRSRQDLLIIWLAAPSAFGLLVVGLLHARKLAAPGLPLMMIGIFVLLAVRFCTKFGRVVVADRTAGFLAVRRGMGREETRIEMTDIAGLQLCCFRDETDGESELRYEINLVLREPPGRRINLLSETGGRKVRSDARRFAEFLGVSLWDHTGSADQ